MATAVNVTVRLKGGIFTKDIPRTVRDQIGREIMRKAEERMTRKGTKGSGGRGAGVRRNTVRTERPDELELAVSSTRIWPRTRGTTWQRKNIAIIKSMAPRVARKAAQRIAEEMGGGVGGVGG